MKKILALLLLIMACCSVCGAFEKPDPNSWVFIGGTKQVRYWLDLKTVKFGRETVTATGMSYNATEKRKTLNSMQFKLDKNEWRILSTSRYYDDGRVEETGPLHHLFKEIFAKSMINAYYDKITELYETMDTTKHTPAWKKWEKHKKPKNEKEPSKAAVPAGEVKAEAEKAPEEAKEAEEAEKPRKKAKKPVKAETAEAEATAAVQDKK